MEKSDFKTSKNKKMASFFVVIGVLLLIGIFAARAYNVNNGEDAGIKEVTFAPEDIKLPEEESNITQIENLEKKEKENKNLLIENPDNTNAGFENVVNKKEPQIVQPAFDINAKGKKDHTASYAPVYSGVQKKKLNQEVNDPDAYYEDSKGSTNKSKELSVISPVQENKSNNITKSAFGTVYNSSGSTAKGTLAKKSDLVKATIHSDQAIGNGQGAIMRLTQEMVLADGTVLPKNSIMYGKADYGSDRVNIVVNRVKTPDKKEYAVSMEIYDNDYIKGVFYNTEIDKAVNKTKDDGSGGVVNDVPTSTNLGNGVKVATNLIKKGANNLSDAAKKNRKLELPEGYILYVKEIKK